MSYNGPERRSEYFVIDERFNKLQDSLMKMQIKVDRLCSHFESEFGNHQTEGNVSKSFTRVNKSITSLEDKIDKQDGRVSKLEKWQAFVLGSTAVILLVLGWLMPTVMRVLVAE